MLSWLSKPHTALLPGRNSRGLCLGPPSPSAPRREKYESNIDISFDSKMCARESLRINYSELTMQATSICMVFAPDSHEYQESTRSSMPHARPQSGLWAALRPGCLDLWSWTFWRPQICRNLSTWVDQGLLMTGCIQHPWVPQVLPWGPPAPWMSKGGELGAWWGGFFCPSQSTESRGASVLRGLVWTQEGSGQLGRALKWQSTCTSHIYPTLPGTVSSWNSEPQVPV